ncbi:MAG: peptidase MA domain-containing protein [Chloroflexi bacterium]|jgi:hypothetical protein|nr:peptidase MA domain-containing protein [Chloroflexota bacterium]
MKQLSQYLIWLVLITAMLLGSFALGCKSDEKVTPQLDALSDAQLLPKPSPTNEPDPTTSFINVISADSTVDFPASLTFNLEAESSHEITDIELRYTIEKVTVTSVTTTIKPDFVTGIHVITRWRWDTRKFDLPPGARINYKWIVTNNTGDKLETESATLIFEDSRHSWSELAEENVRLLWYKGDATFGQELMDAAQTALAKLAQDTGAKLEREARIYIYGDTDELHEALIYPQEWTGGLAFTDYGIIVIGISTDRLSWGKRTIAHELSHLVIHQMTYNPLSNVPTWIDEGLAMFTEGGLRDDLADNLDDALEDDTLFPVRSLGGSFPTDSEEAGLAYAQSYSLVSFLIENYGSEKMMALLELLKQGNSYDDALLEIYEFDVDGLDEEWRTSLGLQPNRIAVSSRYTFTV